MHAEKMMTMAAAAMLSGWVAERVMDSGVRLRGIGPLAGLVGLWVGRWAWAIAGWDPGPRVAGCPIAPAVGGAFAVCAVLKLVTLAFAGSRR